MLYQKYLGMFLLLCASSAPVFSVVTAEKTRKKLLIVMGSARVDSVSERLAKVVFGLVDTVQFAPEIIDLRTYTLGLVDPEGGAVPSAALTRLQEEMKNADAVIFLSPNYNAGYSGVLINAIDAVRSELNNKIVGLIGYSGGYDGGQEGLDALVPVLKTFGAQMPAQAVTIKMAENAFNDAGDIEKQATKDDIHALLQNLHRAIK